MVRSIWCLREKGSKKPDYDVEYGGTYTYFTLRLAYGGFFTKPPGRKYVNGTISYFDYVDVDLFSVHELNYMVIELGYQKEQYPYSHYCIPHQPLDFGLMPLGNDADVLKLISYVPKFRQINVYIESGETRVFTHFKFPSTLVIEPLEPENESPDVDLRRPSQKETGSCSKAMVPYVKYQGAYVTQKFEQVEEVGVQAYRGYDFEFEQLFKLVEDDGVQPDWGYDFKFEQVFEEVEDVGVQPDGGYDFEFEQEFEEEPPQFHFEMPNIDDAFHYDDYSLFAEFDAEYNNADLAGVEVEDSSVESGWRSDSDGDSSVGDSCQATLPKGRRTRKRKAV